MLHTDRRLLFFAIGLSGLAGFVDSLGFLHGMSFFVSFMSGNSTRFAVGLSELSTTALTAFLLIVGFLFGAALGAIIGHLAGTKRRPAVLACVTMLLMMAALLAPHSWPAMLAAMVLAMGMENAVLADDGKVKVGVTYMTGALVRLGHALGHRLLGQADQHWVVDLSLWLGLMIGATIGAVADRLIGINALWIGTILAALLCAASMHLAQKAPSA